MLCTPTITKHVRSKHMRFLLVSTKLEKPLGEINARSDSLTLGHTSYIPQYMHILFHAKNTSGSKWHILSGRRAKPESTLYPKDFCLSMFLFNHCSMSTPIKFSPVLGC